MLNEKHLNLVEWVELFSDMRQGVVFIGQGLNLDRVTQVPTGEQKV